MRKSTDGVCGDDHLFSLEVRLVSILVNNDMLSFYLNDNLRMVFAGEIVQWQVDSCRSFQKRFLWLWEAAIFLSQSG